MGTGVTVQALTDSIFLNPQLKAFRVRAGELVIVSDLDYAKRLASTGMAAFPASDEDAAPYPQAKAEDPPGETPDTEPAGHVEVGPAEAKPSRKKGRVAE